MSSESLKNILTSYMRMKRVQSLTTDELLTQHGASIRRMTNPDYPPLIICTRNEARSLPVLLYACTQPWNRVRPVVIDNASSDHTAVLAQELGIEVVSAPVPGLMRALRKGFEYLSEKQYPCALFTDADCFPIAGWSSHMEETSARFVPSFGQMMGPLFFHGALIRDSIRNIAAISADLHHVLTRRARGHGPNNIVRVPSAQYYEQVANRLDEDWVIGTELHLTETLLKLGGVACNRIDPRLTVFSQGDRYKNVGDILLTILRKKEMRRRLYADWFVHNPGGKDKKVSK